MSDMMDEIGPIPRLLCAHAGRDAARHRLIWALDARLAMLVAKSSEPAIGQIKLTWWYDALTDASGAKGRGEPLVEALHAAAMLPPAGLDHLIDGWEALLGDVDLETYAAGRGGGLFRALAGRDDVPGWLVQAGAAWALWDLSAHTTDQTLAADAIALAARHKLDERPDWPKEWAAMRIAYGLARYDVRRGRAVSARLTPRLYLQLLWLIWSKQ